ncbi:MAG: hypothetical protein ABIQ73_12105 [Acidimicrobiales bacterium]
MDATRLVTDTSFIECPRQGAIHVEYCMGCPRCLTVEEREGQTIVVCEPGDQKVGPLWEPLRTPPAPFRLYDD